MLKKIMFPKPYDIDQLLNDSPVARAMAEPVPDFVETGGDGVSPKSLGSGELGGNMTVQDGYLQSSNYVANTTGWRLTPTGGDFNFAIQADEVHIPDADVTANSFHADVDGDTWWGATQTSFNSNNDNALAYVLKTGVAKFQSITLSSNVAISGIANNTATDIAILDLTHNLVFSVTDADTIAWASGTITLSNGRTFSISSGNTGNMAARTYIYLDTAVSTTVLQTTTTVSSAMGANKKLIAVAQNASGEAVFQVYDGIGGLKLNSSQTNISNNNWTYSGTWSVTDADTIAWASGTLKASNGTSYSITGSNTGNMAAKTYIYFDIAVSSTAFQTTTTATTAIGDGKILIAVAQNGTGEANYLVMNDKQSNIDAAQIVAGSITANEIAAGAITATKISVSQLSAIAADMGSITAGNIVLASTGYIRSGQTAYATGTGWWLGIDGSTPKFSIGDSLNYVHWDGSTLDVTAPVKTVAYLSTWEPINGSSTPVAARVDTDGKVTTADADDTSLDSFDGFVTSNLSAQTPAAFLNSTSGGASTTFSHTANAGTDRVVLYIWFSRNSAGNPTKPTGVTWNGNAMTEVVSSVGNRGGIAVWRYIAGTNGSNQTGDVVVTGSTGTVGQAHYAFTYQYVDQTTPIASSGSETLGSSSASAIQITPTHSYALALAASLFADGSGGANITEPTGHTARYDVGDASIADRNVSDGYYRGISLKTIQQNFDSSQEVNAIVLFFNNSISTTCPLVVAGEVTLSGLTIGSPYYVSNTAGSISTTPGATSIRVGKAFSSTKLFILQP